MTVSPEALEEARHHIRNRLQSHKSGERTHTEAKVLMIAELDALTHPCCSECKNFDRYYKFRDGKNVLILDCKAHLSPIDLWRDHDPGEEVTCKGFIPVEEEIFSLQD